MLRALPSLLPLLCCLCLPVSGRLTAQDKAAPVEKAIGVVDFVKVIDGYPRAIQERKKLEDLRKAMVDQLEAEQKKLDELAAAKDALKEGTRERAVKILELNAGMRHLDGMREILDADYGQAKDRFMVLVYEDLDKAIDKVAREKGLKLVLRITRDLGDGTVTGKANAFNKRLVWFAADEIDITNDVVKLLQVMAPADAKDSPGRAPDAGGTAPTPKK